MKRNRLQSSLVHGVRISALAIVTGTTVLFCTAFTSRLEEGTTAAKVAALCANEEYAITLEPLPPVSADPSTVNEPSDVHEIESEYLQNEASIEIEETPAVHEPEPEPLYSEADIIALAQMAYGESWGTQSDTEMSATMWCACNRLDSNDPYYDDCETIYDIVTQSGQFRGYSPKHPIEDRLVWLAEDVLERWSSEKRGETDVGRTLPPEFCYFWGDNRNNHFTTEHNGRGEKYDWHLQSPYDN